MGVINTTSNMRTAHYTRKSSGTPSTMEWASGGINRLLPAARRERAEAAYYREMGASVSAPANPPAWHPDPSGVARLRYWDGGAWTDHVAM